MKKATIGAVAALLLIAAAAIMLAGGNDTPAKGTYLTAAPAHTTSAPKTTQAPSTTAPPVTTSAPAETPEPVDVYQDVTSGERIEGGTKVKNLYGESGILSGTVENGKFTSNVGSLRDEEGNQILVYRQQNNADLGHLELIMYPQDGYVNFLHDGDMVAKMKYETWQNFEGYKIIACEPDALPEDTEYFMIRRFSDCS